MSDYLIHHGIKGQKWGVRRFQDYDGKRIKKSDDNKPKDHSNVKKAVKIGAIAVASALAVYGGYKLYESGAINNLVSFGKAGASDLGISDSDSKTSNETIDTLITSTNDLSGGAHINSCGQTSIAIAFSKAGIPCKAKADLDSNGVGKTHDVLGEIEKIFLGQLKTQYGDYNRNVVRQFTNNPIASDSNNLKSELKTWFGDRADGIICTDVLGKYGKTEKHAFNFSIEKGNVSLYDGANRFADASFLLDAKAKKGIKSGSIQAIRTDTLDYSNIDKYALYKLVEDR